MLELSGPCARRLRAHAKRTAAHSSQRRPCINLLANVSYTRAVPVSQVHPPGVTTKVVEESTTWKSHELLRSNLASEALHKNEWVSRKKRQVWLVLLGCRQTIAHRYELERFNESNSLVRAPPTSALLTIPLVEIQGRRSLDGEIFSSRATNSQHITNDGYLQTCRGYNTETRLRGQPVRTGCPAGDILQDSHWCR